MPISTLPRYILNAGEFASTGTRLYAVCKGAPESDLCCAELNESMITHVRELEKQYNKESLNEFNKQLADQDEKRDNTVARLSAFIRGQQYSFDDGIAKSAETLYDIMKRHDYGSVRKSYAEQSTVLRAMLVDLSSPDIKDAVEKTGTGQAITKLAEEQKTFEEIYQKKVEQEVKNESTPITELIKPLSQDIFELLVHLNSRERLHPAQYRELNEKVNEIVTEIGNKARTRNNRKAGASDTGQENE